MNSAINSQDTLVDIEIDKTIDKTDPKHLVVPDLEKKQELWKTLYEGSIGVIGIVIFCIGLITIDNTCIYKGALVLEGLAYIGLSLALILRSFSNDKCKKSNCGQSILAMIKLGNLILKVILVIYVSKGNCETSSITYIVSYFSYVYAVIMYVISLFVYN